MQNTQNLNSQPSTPAHHNIKKADRIPSRAQINLKSRRKKNIPQIKIELDSMLHEAFNEMNCQPRKNIRIGNNDIYVLDNQLLRDYVQAVYDQYGIQDPLAQSIRTESHIEKLRSTSHCGIKGYQTPEKHSIHSNQAGYSEKIQPNTKNPRSSYKSNKTAQRINKLKQNFQSELQSYPTSVFEQEQKTAQKNKQQLGMLTRAKETTNKRPQIKVMRRSSQNLPNQSRQGTNKNQSFLLRKTKNKYCLMCEEPLQNDLINTHERQCEQLQKLLNTPNLKIEQISQILGKKITTLQKQVSFYKNSIHEDVHRMQDLLNQINQQQFISNTQENDDDEEDNTLIKAFSTFSTIKCMETLDKLKWFKKMKLKAQMKKGRAGTDRGF